MKAIRYEELINSAVKNIPKVVSLEITTRCPLDCVYCERDNIISQDMTVENLRIIKERIKDFKGVVICGIGEPFSNTAIYNIVPELADKSVIIVTSGTIEIDFKNLNRESNVDYLVVSLDAANEEKMKAITGKYNFKNLLKNLNSLAFKKKPMSIINTTINAYNVEELIGITRFSEENHINALNIDLPFGNYNNNEDFIFENIDYIYEKIWKAYKLSKELKILFMNPFVPKCLHGETVVGQIALNGNYYPCCYVYSKNISFGNLLESDFNEIWESENYKKFCRGEFCNQCGLLKSIELLAKARGRYNNGAKK